jgi:tetratricopeptide (TPR) repeat protein
LAKNSNNKRHRGVRGSRKKLAQALTEAGLKTQAALAERIADLEDLDTAPKDLVNRLFRELPVEVTSLERVARALGVDAYSLYKTADERDESLPQDREQKIPRKFAARLTAVAALAVVVVLAFNWDAVSTIGNGTGPGQAATGEIDTAPLDLGAATLVVMPLSGDVGGTLRDALRNSLEDHFSVATNTSAALLQNLDAKTAADRLRTEVVIDGDIVTVGRLTAVRIYLLAYGVRQQIWGESWPATAYSNQHQDIAAIVSRAAKRAFGMPIPENSIGHYPLAPVQDDYLEGEFHADRPSNELNIKRAQSRFEAALRQDANYARAHAGLCQTLLEEHWMSDEERALKDAARACGQALQLDRDDPVVAAAHAHFLSRTGRNDEAIELYEKTNAAYPQDAAVLYGLANALLAEFRQTGENETLKKAKDIARSAADIDPIVWKPLFSLAAMEWFDGNLSGAIAASEQALQRDENEKIMGNLGSFYICSGDFEKARDTYIRAKQLNPDSYIGDEFLGQAYYFMGEFQRSAEFRQRAIDGIATGAPEIHEMWGNLGDSYRQIGSTQKAIDAYTRAAMIAERDHLRGTAPVADRAARAYYYTTLNSLDATSVPDSVLGNINDELAEIAEALNSASALRRMAQTYLLRNETGKARASLERAATTCPGYRDIPDLASL